MNKRKKKYTIFQKLTAVFLMLTLLWLTISTPFVSIAQHEIAKHHKALSIDASNADCQDCGTEEETGNNNNIEEKVPGSTNLAEEFLHEHSEAHHFYIQLSLFHKLENADSYTAFHGELLVPPPNAA